MIRPENYATREAWIGALIQEADRLAKEALALPEIADPPVYPWEAA